MLKMSFTVSFWWEKFLDAALIRQRRLIEFLFSDAALIRGGGGALNRGRRFNRINTVFLQGVSKNQINMHCIHFLKTSCDYSKYRQL